MYKATKKNKHTASKIVFLVLGIVMGVMLNIIVITLLDGLLFRNLFFLLFGLGTLGLAIYFFNLFYLNKDIEVKISVFSRLRFTLLGIAMASFAYALVDVYDFSNSGLNVFTFLCSIALGGIISIFERLIDLWEKKEL